MLLHSGTAAALNLCPAQMQAIVPPTKQLEDSYALPGKSAYESVPSMCARLRSPVHLKRALSCMCEWRA